MELPVSRSTIAEKQIKKHTMVKDNDNEHPCGFLSDMSALGVAFCLDLFVIQKE
jgi:hypothetical protein